LRGGGFPVAPLFPVTDVYPFARMPPLVLCIKTTVPNKNKCNKKKVSSARSKVAAKKNFTVCPSGVPLSAITLSLIDVLPITGIPGTWGR
jgi:hypothetical protein